jgi:hypothetical protein
MMQPEGEPRHPPMDAMDDEGVIRGLDESTTKHLGAIRVCGAAG